MGLPLSNDGKPVPSPSKASLCGLIPKGAKNVAVAKEFLKYLIQPQVLNELLKTGLGRNMPAMPAIVKDDPWWLDQGPASGGLCRAGPARPDRTELLDLQPGLCPGPERACLADRLGRHHPGRA